MFPLNILVNYAINKQISRTNGVFLNDFLGNDFERLDGLQAQMGRIICTRGM